MCIGHVIYFLCYNYLLLLIVLHLIGMICLPLTGSTWSLSIIEITGYSNHHLPIVAHL